MAAQPSVPLSPFGGGPSSLPSSSEIGAVNLEDLNRKVTNLESYLSNLYVPKHMDSMLKKVGNIEMGVQRAQESMATCYNITFFLVFVFLLLLLGVVYLLWRLNYFKFLTRQNLFRRYTRPKSCYACYRPWRKSAQRRTDMTKGSFSSPELMRDQGAPSLNTIREAELTSGSSSSSSASASE